MSLETPDQIWSDLAVLHRGEVTLGKLPGPKADQWRYTWELRIAPTWATGAPSVAHLHREERTPGVRGLSTSSEALVRAFATWLGWLMTARAEQEAYRAPVRVWERVDEGHELHLNLVFQGGWYYRIDGWMPGHALPLTQPGPFLTRAQAMDQGQAHAESLWGMSSDPTPDQPEEEATP